MTVTPQHPVRVTVCRAIAEPNVPLFLRSAPGEVPRVTVSTLTVSAHPTRPDRVHAELSLTTTLGLTINPETGSVTGCDVMTVGGSYIRAGDTLITINERDVDTVEPKFLEKYFAMLNSDIPVKPKTELVFRAKAATCPIGKRLFLQFTAKSLGFQLTCEKSEEGYKHIIQSINKTLWGEACALSVGDVLVAINGNLLTHVPPRKIPTLLDAVHHRNMLEFAPLQ